MFIAWANARADAFPQQIRLLVATGFFGAYTTFSTYALESVTLGLDGRWTDFVLNVIIGNALSLAAALIGVLLVQRALGG
jgi:CrcB protein